MTSLNRKAAHQYWKNYDDSMIYRVIAFMETVEQWTIDGNPEFEQSLTSLSELLDKQKKFKLGQEQTFVDLSCYMTTGRILRLLQLIDSIEPGSASQLLMFAEKNSNAGNEKADLFIKRNMVFERLRLLTRVFAKERFELITKVLENEDNT